MQYLCTVVPAVLSYLSVSQSVFIEFISDLDLWRWYRHPQVMGEGKWRQVAVDRKGEKKKLE